jgi:hypothetical protein
MSSLRPSNLPKLAVCPCYEGSATAGPAAERGSLLDAAFRAELTGSALLRDKLSSEEQSAISWSVSVVRAIAGRNRILAREEDCRTRMLGLEGTADAVVPARLTHFDLKTGLRRNYREQMAAYSLGLMEAHFADSWTAHLLYCDLREIESLPFTHAEAREIVEAVIVHVENPHREPVPCEYCAWCAKADTCPARRPLAADGLRAAQIPFDFEAVVTDPAELGRFLAACAVVEEFNERARAIAVERLKSGGELPGWKLVTRQGSEFVDAVTVGHHIQAMGFGPVLAAYGTISARKFRELWSERMGGKPFPEEAVKHSPPISYLEQNSKPNPNKPTS